MKIFLCILAGVMFCSSIVLAQNIDSASTEDWKFNTEMDFYFTDPFFILPIITADKDWLHLEARYNYEELKTFSGWIGYNFSGGKKFEYNIVPMAGFVVGRINGFAPGLELGFNFWDIEFSSQSEYVFDTEDSENNFYYNWTDLSYSPLNWLYFGLSVQRTKAYETDLDIQRGLLAGVSYKNLEMTGYYFNPGMEDQFFLLSLTAGF